MKLWTTQTDEVWQLLQEQGVTRVKREYIRRKYRESAWSFRIAYDFMSRKLAQKVPPEGAESPVWLFADPGWAGEHPVPLEVPEEELLLFDLRKWYRVLALSYVRTEQEEAAFAETLRNQGIRDSIQVFCTPFYPPQKRQIQSSWEKIFCLPEDPRLCQAACWQLKQEWRL